MKKKTGVVISSAAAIAVCASVMAGSTYALFTSESKTDIVVKSATVDVSARIDDIVANHSVWNAETGKYEATGEGLFSGESVSEVEGTLNLNYVAPGDIVKFNIYVENNSTVDVKYRVKMACTEGEELLNGLKLTVGGEDYSGLVSYVSEWQQWSGDNKIVPVVIELPVDAGNEYQGLSCKISYSVEAIQGNGATNNDDAKFIKTKVSTAAELKTALDYVAVNGGTVQLTKDIELNNYTGYFGKQITLDLNGKTLSGTNSVIWEGVVINNGKASVTPDSSLTVKNGTMDIKATGNINALSSYTELNLVNANVNIRKAESVSGDLAIAAVAAYFNGHVNISGSTLTSDSYCIATNANKAVATTPAAVFNIENSTLGDETTRCAICFNVNGTLNLKNCTITGTDQAVMIRGGMATIDGCTLNKVGVGGKADDEAWSDGCQVASAALCLGNKTKMDSYQYPTNVTLTDTVINTVEGTHKIYIHGNENENFGAALTYESSVGEVVVGGGCVKTNVVVSNTEEAQVALDNATDNCGIILKAGEYGKLILGPSAVCVADEKQIDYYSHHRLTRTVNNLSIVGEDGVVVDGFELKGTLFNNNPDNKTVFNPVLENYECFYMRYYITGINIENITFKDGIYLNSEGYETVELSDITIKNCSTTADGDHMANQPANKLADIRKAVNVTVENCVVTNRFQGVYLMGVENATVTGCHFENTVHNAIALQDFSASGTHCSGNLVITGNEFNGIGDRVIRFGGLDNAAVVIKNNTIGANCGDADGELSKLASYTENTTFELVNNGDGFVIVGYNN